MITKKKVIYTTGTVVLLILNLFLFTFSANQQLKPGSEDRGYVDGWYCSSSKENKVNENDSSYVQNRDYTCQMPGNPESGKCLFEITDTYNCKTRISKKNGGTNYFNRGILWDYESCVFNDSYLNTDLNIHKTEDDNDLDGIDGNPGCAYDEHQDSGEPGQGIGTKLEDYCKGNGSIMGKPNKVGNSDDTNSVLWEYTEADSGAGVDGHEKDCEDYERPYCIGSWNGTIWRQERGCAYGYCANGHDADTVASGLGLDANNNGVCDRDSYWTCEGGGDNGDRVYYRDYCSGGGCSFREYNRVDCGTNYTKDRRTDTDSDSCSCSTSCTGTCSGTGCVPPTWTVSDSDSCYDFDGKDTTLVHKGCSNGGLTCYTYETALSQPHASCSVSCSCSC